MLNISKIVIWLLPLMIMMPLPPLYAQELAEEDLKACIIGDDCTAEPVAGPVGSNDFVVVAFADSLGPDSVQVEAMLAGNPNVRISPAKDLAEYLIARYPDFPNTLVLIDNRELSYFDELSMRQYDGSDERIAKMYQRFASQRYLRSDYLPVVIGALDDASFALELNGELQQILWARRFLSFRGRGHPTLNLVTVTTECDETQQSGDCVPSETYEIRNRLSTRQHVTLVPIDQYSLRFKTRAESPTLEFTLDPRAVRPLATLSSGLHYAVISSQQPIDLTLLVSRNGRVADIPPAWAVGVISTPSRRLYRGGGGKAVASLFAAPWQVQLYSTDSNTPASLRANAMLGKVAWELHEKTHRCGGSVIGQDGDRYIVLTAAHCVANEPFAGPELRQNVLKYRRVKLGTLNLRYGGTTFAIDSVVVHRDYKAGAQVNDIALLRIKPDASTLVQNTKSVRAIAPATRPLTPASRVKWFGWGFTEETEGKVARITSSNVVQRNPAQLREGEMEVLERQKCSARAGYAKVTDFMLCAVTPRDSEAARTGKRVFTCQGDSGGPITGIENGRTVQVGIVSWAVGCGAKDNPSVSVNVHKYRSWINIAKTKFVSGKSVTQ